MVHFSWFFKVGFKLLSVMILSSIWSTFDYILYSRMSQSHYAAEFLEFLDESELLGLASFS